MSYLAPPIHWEQILFDVQLAGYQPVLAHPERYIYWRTDFSAFNKFKDRGCLFQMNALSPTGYYGWEVMESAEKLLKENFIDCVGTDIHHQRHIDGFKQPLQIKSIKEFEQAFHHPLNKM
jgi:tyrosine-protein phosphatase YwqE